MSVRLLRDEERPVQVLSGRVYSDGAYEVGVSALLRVAWAEKTMPTTVKCVVTGPDGTEHPAEVLSIGNYFQARVLISLAGDWRYEFQAAGSHRGSVGGSFFAIERRRRG